MIVKATILWVVGLLTLVPYATYYLFFQASRDQYAILITFVLFWIFGYWGIAGPLLALVKVRRVFRTLEQVKSKEELLVTLRSPDSQAVAIDLIASENHIPRFLAARVYRLLIVGLGERASRVPRKRNGSNDSATGSTSPPAGDKPADRPNKPDSLASGGSS